MKLIDEERSSTVSLIPGFNKKCSNEEYHGDREYKSSSALKLMLKDPHQYYKNYVLNEPQTFSADALTIGSYAHTRILEPELLEEEYSIFTGGRRSGEAWKTFQLENEGKTIVTASQKSLVDKMIDTYEETTVKIGEKDIPLSDFFSKGKAEETLCGILDGYKVKTRFDYRKEIEVKANGLSYVDHGYISDLKTTGSSMSNREEVEEICSYWGYDISAALYVDLVSQETGVPHDFYFVFLSKKNFEAKIFKASEAMLERGRKSYKEAIRRLKEAEKTGVYFENKIEELR